MMQEFQDILKTPKQSSAALLNKMQDEVAPSLSRFSTPWKGSSPQLLTSRTWRPSTRRNSAAKRPRNSCKEKSSR